MKWVKLSVFLAAVLVTVVVLSYSLENWRGARALHRAKAKLVAEGVKLDLAEHIPEKVAPERNFGSAPIFLELTKTPVPGTGGAVISDVFNQVRELAPAETREEFEEQIGRLKVEQTGTEPTVGPEDPLETLENLIADFEAIRNGLANRLEFPEARWNQTLAPGTAPSDYPLMHLPTMGLMRLLTVQARLDLYQGNAERALEDVGILLRIGEMYAREPFVIFHVIYLADLALVFPLIEEGLLMGVWNADHLERLSEWMERIDIRHAFQKALRGEVAFLLTLEPLFRNEGGFPRDPHLDEPSLFFGLDVPSGWALRGLSEVVLTLHEAVQGLTADKLLGDQMAAFGSSLQAHESERISHWMATMLAAKFQGVGGVVLETARRLVVVRTAVQLERIRDRQGAYPTTLEALGQVPSDPLDGASLQYAVVDGHMRVWVPTQPEELRLDDPDFFSDRCVHGPALEPTASD